MFHLIYTSAETQEFSALNLKKLLINARLRNCEVSVTGMLLYHSGHFLQALEGEEGAVRGIFKRIEKDERHGEIHMLRSLMSLGNRRLFGEWSMGFADVDGASELLKGYIDTDQVGSLATLEATGAFDLLQTVGRNSFRKSA